MRAVGRDVDCEGVRVRRWVLCRVWIWSGDVGERLG